MVDVPAGLTAATMRREDPAGVRWLAELLTLVERFLDGLACEQDGAVTHGEVAPVVPVLCGRGEAVLKISFPLPLVAGEVAALRAFDGRGSVRLWEADIDASALLLERAGA